MIKVTHNQHTFLYGFFPPIPTQKKFSGSSPSYIIFVIMRCVIMRCVIKLNDKGGSQSTYLFIRFLSTNTDPEEVLRLLPFIYHLCYNEVCYKRSCMIKVAQYQLTFSYGFFPPIPTQKKFSGSSPSFIICTV